MKNLLAISSSPGLSHSYSRDLLESFSSVFSQTFNDSPVSTRDLGRNPIPHLDEATIGAFYTPEDQLSEEQKKIVELSDSLIDELESADIVAIAAPMHNFSISSGLKSYIDHVVRVGRTFQYSENGPEGRLSGKKVFIITSRGGNYSQAPLSALDHQEPYLRTVLSFIGLDDVEFIHCQGLAMGEEAKQQAIDEAQKQISEHIAKLAEEKE